MSKYSDKTFEKILDDMCRRVKECSTMEGSFIYTALAPFAMELALLYLQLEQDEKNGFADTADYEHLKKLALDRGIIPNQATHAVGIGKFDVEIPVGSKFSINTYSFISGEQITGKQDGYFYYKMTSEQVGTEVNTVIGKLTAITFIRNLNYAYLTEITIPAEDDEDIETFRSRYFETFNKKSFGGNKADYIDKINSFNGVGGCKVYPLWNDGGTVKIIVLNSNYEVPSSTLINTIQNEIDPNIDGNGDGYAPIGHKVTIAGVSACNIVVECRLVLDSGYTFESVLPNLIISVNNYFKSLSKNWANSEYITVRVAQVTTVLLDEYGCDQMEKIMGIEGNEHMSLEMRRLYIITKANNTLPYTIRNLERKIISLLGNNSFSMDMNYNDYHLKIILFVQNFDKIEYLKEHIEGMIPCKIILDLIVIYHQYSLFTRFTYGDLRTMTHSYMREHYFGNE